MKLKELYEGISEILYHVRSLIGAYNILKDNRFRLSSILGKESEKRVNKNNLFYLSTARNLSSSYLRDNDNIYGKVIFVIDGKKLSSNLKGHPVDFWGRKFRLKNPNYHEMEDRIVSNKPFINNANKYIKEIHILNDHDKYQEFFHSITRKIVLLAKILEIPYYIYKSNADFLLLDKRKSTKKVPYKTSKAEKEELQWLNKYDKEFFNEVYPWIELYRKTSYDELSNKAKEIYNNLNNPDILKPLKNALYGTVDKTGTIEKLSSIFKHENISDINDFHSILKKKWNIND